MHNYIYLIAPPLILSLNVFTSNIVNIVNFLHNVYSRSSFSKAKSILNLTLSTSNKLLVYLLRAALNFYTRMINFYTNLFI